jgi:cytochrome P450
MDGAAEFELPVLPLESLEYSANPDPWIEAARKQHPWLARFSQGYVVHGYEAACDLFGDDDNLIAGYGAVAEFYGVSDSLWGRFMRGTLSATRGEQHDRLRGCLAHAFTPRRANRERGMMQRVITELLDEWAPLGEFDFAVFASYFPVTVMCGLLGIGAKRVTGMRDALECQLMSLTLDPATKPLFLGAFDQIWAFVNEVIEEREASGQFDEEHLLDAMIAAKNAGHMDETELRFMVITTIIGGFDTSKNQLTSTMSLLLSRPEMYQRCAEDLDYCRKVSEESFRHSAIVSKFRQAANDFTYRGHDFRKGEVIVISAPLANRDPAMFPEPTRFDPERANVSRHVGLGRGPHICIGQFIARAQVQEGLHLIAQRLRNPRLAGERTRRPMLGAWGLRSLPIAFDPA